MFDDLPISRGRRDGTRDRDANSPGVARCCRQTVTPSTCRCALNKGPRENMIRVRIKFPRAAIIRAVNQVKAMRPIAFAASS